MQTEPTKKTPVEIEAPTPEQIMAARRMQREQKTAFMKKPSEDAVRQRRSGIEGVILMIIAVALIFFLHPLGAVAWILAAIPFLGGVIVLLKTWQ
jgi:ABC-type Na+ efflux pump permease subunit